MQFTLKMNDVNKIIKLHGLEKDGRVNVFFRDTVERFSDPYVPFKTGQLKNNIRHPNNHSIKYVSPYAHYMYFGKVAIGPSRPKGIKRTISGIDLKYSGAPKRGARWDKRMMSDRGKEIIKDVEKFIRSGK